MRVEDENRWRLTDSNVLPMLLALSGAGIFPGCAIVAIRCPGITSRWCAATCDGRTAYSMLAQGVGRFFLSLAPHFGFGAGVDLNGESVRVAQGNTPTGLSERVIFLQADASALAFSAESFDVVLNRHAGVFPGQVVRVLCPGGYFITQQVGGKNSQNLFDAFGWGSNGAYWRECWEEWGVPLQDVDSLAEAFRAAGCRIVATAEYDVPYYFLDLESFIFWLKAVPLPEPFDLERWGPTLVQFLDRYTTLLGIETNEHRELLVVRKR